MGQFDLLEYCQCYKERKANQSHGFQLKIAVDSEISEMWHKYRFIKFVDVPPFLQEVENYSGVCASISKNSLKTTRGEQALQKYRQFAQLKWSIELEFDHSIIIWHLATSVCYLLDEDHDNETMKISKHVSNYMMYLLAMCPALLLSEHSKSFWLDHAYDNLEKLASPAIDIRNVASTLHSSSDNVQLESRERTFENLKGDVLELATILRESDNKWEMIKDVWIEMFCHAAFSSQHINHVKQLGEGIEFLSLIWLFIFTFIIDTVFKM
ncbi:hypothetical protein SLEP1_g23922 [Rubroshorea leprosula]|uniref:Uncharacterized protein n=1 Tax=Rubroshorea leprosula TaxID=152421 RepID=A0AAV5JK68_9ROSI|nr:hypothetical protein SLEP1_g23922 [Rubroshorea leprosula]